MNARADIAHVIASPPHSVLGSESLDDWIGGGIGRIEGSIVGALCFKRCLWGWAQER